MEWMKKRKINVNAFILSFLFFSFLFIHSFFLFFSFHSIIPSFSLSISLSLIVVIEDTALCFDAMGELPGPYIKWFLESIGPAGLCRMLDGFPSRTARAICTLVLIDSDEQVHVFQGITPGRIAQVPQGEHLFGWDPIFIPSEGQLSYAQMTVEEKNRISHRSRALAQLREYLEGEKR